MRKVGNLAALAYFLCFAVTIAASPIPGDSKDQAAISGPKARIQGTIVKRGVDGFTMRDVTGSELSVSLTSSTKVEERKGNPFRSAKKYSPAELLPGLNVQVEGWKSIAGSLVAEKIKFSEQDLAMARTVESRVEPVERRVGDTESRLGQTENRLGQTEQSAQRLSDQVAELNEVSNIIRGGAKAAQDTADNALQSVNKANERISALDDFEERKSATITFKAGSSKLSPEAQAQLDEIATEAKAEHGYVIEVAGFASSDGNDQFNRSLSQARAEAVVHYLAETHTIPMRRIVMPLGYGTIRPVADNSTLAGRKMNRRVEVKILVSRGLNVSGMGNVSARTGDL